MLIYSGCGPSGNKVSIGKLEANSHNGVISVRYYVASNYLSDAHRILEFSINGKEFTSLEDSNTKKYVMVLLSDGNSPIDDELINVETFSEINDKNKPFRFVRLSIYSGNGRLMATSISRIGEGDEY